jgi:uncharacterized protein
MFAVVTGVSFLVVHDGNPVWRIVRVAVVASFTYAVWRGLGLRGAGRAWTALLLGITAFPIGIGIALPHVAKTGVTAMAWAGVLVLLGALLAFGTGLVWLFRGRDVLPALPVAGAAVVTLVMLTWTLGQAIAATNVPRTAVGSRTPADVGLTFRDVEFAAADGVTLSGWYVPSRSGAAAVVLHGSGSTRSSVLDHAAVLARHGFGVLLYDARGHGRSDGRAMDFGWFGDDDLGGAVAFLQKQSDVNPERIAAVGMSMGGETAIGAAASIDAIAAVVAEGATNRVAEDKDWLSDVHGLRGTLTEAVDWLTYGFADLLTSARPPIPLHDAVYDAAPLPVLLIAAGESPDEVDAAHFIQRSSPDTVQVWIAPETQHTDALDVHPEQWETRVVGFLEHALGVDRGSAS